MIDDQTDGWVISPSLKISRRREVTTFSGLVTSRRGCLPCLGLAEDLTTTRVTTFSGLATEVTTLAGLATLVGDA